MSVTTPAARPRKATIVPTQPRRWKSININLYLYGALAVLAFLGTIWAFQAAGVWSISGKVTASGEKIQVTGADPAEIKGWMKISDVLTAYHLPKEEFYARYSIPQNVSVDAALKDIEANAPSFSVTDLRTWLTQRQGP
ncbi:MAG: hypothetical protein KIS91_18205 [Anaerolineae bacterium]|nr:hypothetical protein [Anaerolineae bacterium]